MSTEDRNMFMSMVDITVRTTTGHTARFTAGEPKRIPEGMHKAAMAAGVLPLEQAKEAEQRILAAAKAKEADSGEGKNSGRSGSRGGK